MRYSSVLARINGTYAGQYANGVAEVLFNDILRRVALVTRMLLPWPLMSCAELTCSTGDSRKSDIPQLRLPPTCNKKIKLYIAGAKLTANKILKVWPWRLPLYIRRHVHLLHGACRYDKFFERLLH